MTDDAKVIVWTVQGVPDHEWAPVEAVFSSAAAAFFYVAGQYEGSYNDHPWTIDQDDDGEWTMQKGPGCSTPCYELTPFVIDGEL